MNEVYVEYGDVIAVISEEDDYIKTTVSDGVSKVNMVSFKKSHEYPFAPDFGFMRDRRYAQRYVSGLVDYFVRGTINYG